MLPASVLQHVALASAALALASCAVDAGPSSEPVERVAQASSTMMQVTSFGSNPGNLLMFSYVPQGMPSDAPLVLALHGCGQSATSAENMGWNGLADSYKFYVVYPQQQSANNTESCFNWFGNTSGNTADITRGQGEAASVIQMIDTMKSTYSIDPKRIFVSGFSAGAAYTVALLAMYPDVFAAGASYSGIPFGCANSLTTAYTCMSAPPSNTPQQWGTLAQAAFPGYAGPYPRLSVWQGSGDYTVSTSNLAAIVAQWTDLTGTSVTPSSTDTVGGNAHNVYSNACGVPQVESHSITGMSHAVAIDTATGCGMADTYDVNEQICAADYSAKFFGLEGTQGSSSGGCLSGSSGGGSGGGGSSGSSSGVVSMQPVGDGGIGGGAHEAPDAGVPAPATLPGCSMSPPDRMGLGWVLAGLALGLTALVRRVR